AVHPAAMLHGWLSVLEPASAVRIAPGDRYRVVRRLETVLALRAGEETPTGQLAPNAHISYSVIVLTTSRDVLAARIAARARAMFETGLVEEAFSVRSRCGDVPALTGLGYREALAYGDGLATQEEAIAALRLRTVQYAKRQQTWFRRIHEAQRIASDDIEEAATAVHALAREFFAAT
ncbi:MAG: tRNA (adenosine(37)-N6)-dimethylallyltransferase MiaA, partial [Candidatus Eremiobacteraeota bacterium]|nr:tRNA (adenosine(37)-N6)-dimethylallyltransferase MiaA [Candidatus Eremiobacteraeota bacterium]